MKFTAQKLFIAVAAASMIGAASAHHSRANFLLNEIIEISGTITEKDWVSPHVWFTIEGAGPSGEVEEWVIEGNAIPALQKLGWSQDTFEVGDHVIAYANPDRNPDKKLVFLDKMLSSGTGEMYYNLALPRDQAAALAAAVRATEPSTDFSGQWERNADSEYFLLGSFNKPEDWPVTEVGAAELAEFDLANDPFVQCQSPAMPRVIFSPFGHQWTWNEDKTELFIDKEFSDMDRTVYFDLDEVPADAEPSRMGFSLGSWDGDTMVIETSNFVDDMWGNARGLSSSDQKVVTERWTLIEDGFGMHFAYVIEDPVYLREPVTVEGTYFLRKPYTPAPEIPCTPDSAQRHIQFEQEMQNQE